MNKPTTILLITSLAVTVAALATWRMTGGDYYTKFQVVEQVDRVIDPNDPLAGTGFYDGDSSTETVTRDEFRFGLLPTPTRLFDKHAVSVVSIVSPFWVATVGMAWFSRRRRKSSQAS